MSNTEKTTESFIFYDSFDDAIRDLPDDQQLHVYRAISDFSLRGIEPQLTGFAGTVFKLMRPQLVANMKRREDGKKGGRPPKKPVVSKAENHRFLNDKTTGSEEKKPNGNVNGNGNANDNGNGNANDNGNGNANDNGNGNANENRNGNGNSREAKSISENFQPTPETLAYAESQLQFSRIENEKGVARMELENFRAYYAFGNGKDKTSDDWDGRFKAWIIRAINNPDMRKKLQDLGETLTEEGRPRSFPIC